MSDTPRTDAQLSTPKVVLTDGRYCYTEPWSGAVSADFARTLERDHAALMRSVDAFLLRLDNDPQTRADAMIDWDQLFDLRHLWREQMTKMRVAMQPHPKDCVSKEKL